MIDDEPRFVLAHNLGVPDTPWMVFDRRDAKAQVEGWAEAEAVRKQLEEGSRK